MGQRNLLLQTPILGTQSNLGARRHPQTQHLFPTPQVRRLRRAQHGHPPRGRL